MADAEHEVRKPEPADDRPFCEQLLDCLPIGLAAWSLDDPDDDRSLKLRYANIAAGAHLGFELRHHVGQHMPQIFPEIDAPRLKQYADVCREGTRKDLGPQIYGDNQVLRSTFSVTALPVPGRMVAVLFENQSAMKRAEAEARNLNQFLDSVIEHIPAMIFLKDAEHLRFERFNRAAEELLGLSRTHMIGKSDIDFFPKEQAEFFVSKDREVLARKTLEDIPAEPIETPNGTRWLHTRKIPLLDEYGNPQHLLGISIDITERRQADELLRASHRDLERRVVERTAELRRSEEQFRHAQKMEAIGRLAGGIAHDFNNLMSVVLGYSDMILRGLEAGDPRRGDVQEIRRAGAKAADLTRQLLAFSRQQLLQPRVLDLYEVVNGVEQMFRRLIGADIELVIRRHSGVSRVKADRGQIEQVLMNLVVNARDAMPSGGRLTIELSEVEVAEPNLGQQEGAKPGSYVMLSVGDSGMGMDKPTMGRIFEPFFTTKEKSKGTGLGLSTVFGIIKQSGGWIHVESEPGAGAIFRVYLPATEEAASEAYQSPLPVSQLRGQETVLLVEDEEQVRRLAASILRRHGYNVLEADRPSTALSLEAAHSGQIQLLLSDIIMPEMSGLALTEKLKLKRPELLVLLMSGYTDDASTQQALPQSVSGFLPKPITPEALTRRVREILDRHGPAKTD